MEECMDRWKTVAKEMEREGDADKEKSIDSSNRYRQTNRQTGRQTDRQTIRQTDRQAGRQTDRQRQR